MQDRRSWPRFRSFQDREWVLLIRLAKAPAAPVVFDGDIYGGGRRAYLDKSATDQGNDLIRVADMGQGVAQVIQEVQVVKLLFQLLVSFSQIFFCRVFAEHSRCPFDRYDTAEL